MILFRLTARFLLYRFRRGTAMATRRKQYAKRDASPRASARAIIKGNHYEIYAEILSKIVVFTN
jgi:hypothetical protein